MRATILYIAGFIAAAEAQETYITTTGYTARPQCTSLVAPPSYYFQPFAYTLQDTVR